MISSHILIECILVITINLSLTYGYNFNADKVILHSHFRQKEQGYDPMKVSIKKHLLARPKRTNANGLFRPPNGNIDDTGRFSEDGAAGFGRQTYYFSDFSGRQKREVSESSSITEIPRPERSLFGELTETTRSRNITFVKPSKVKVFGLDPYNAVILGPKFNDNKRIQLNQTESHNNIDKLTKQQNIKYTIKTQQYPNRKQSMHSQAEIPKPLYENNHTQSQKVIEEYNWKNISFNSDDFRNKYRNLIKDLIMNPQMITSLSTHNIHTNDTRGVSEVALLKVLEILTKTLKKIMKQHEQMKKMHREVIFASTAFMNMREDIVEHFKDFDIKQRNFINEGEGLAALEFTLMAKQDTFLKKEKEFSEKLKQFEELKRQFYKQQQEFYKQHTIISNNNFRTYMVQSQIDKKQKEISHKQNILSKILYKSKITLNDLRQNNISLAGIVQNISSPSVVLKKPNVIFPWIKTSMPKRVNTNERSLNSNAPHIIDETDIKDIDELVYEIYFKNTTIDKLLHDSMKGECCVNCKCDIKSKRFQKGYRLKRNDTDLIRNKETLAEETKIEKLTTKASRLENKNHEYSNKTSTSLILEISNITSNLNKMISSVEDAQVSIPRIKRSIERQNKKLEGGKLKSRKHSRHSPKVGKHIKKFQATNIKATDTYSKDSTTSPKSTNEEINKISRHLLTLYQVLKHKSATKKAITQEISKFEEIYKAKSYCNEIGPNSSESLDLCIIKAINKTRSNVTLSTPMPMVKTSTRNSTTSSVHANSYDKILDFKSELKENIPSSTSVTTTFTPSTQSPYFPDNDELEAKIGDYELPSLKTEGTIFWDDSMHASNYIPNDPADNDGASDVLPGDDSAEGFDPVALELQAKKRSYVRRLNEQILKKAMRTRVHTRNKV